jgi:hypothetical protein
MPPLAAPASPAPPPLPRSTPLAPTRPTSSSARIQLQVRWRFPRLTGVQELPRAAGQEELSGGRIEDDGLAVLRTRCIFISHGDMSCSSSRTADFRYQQKPSQPLAA